MGTDKSIKIVNKINVARPKTPGYSYTQNSLSMGNIFNLIQEKKDFIHERSQKEENIKLEAWSPQAAWSLPATISIHMEQNHSVLWVGMHISRSPGSYLPVIGEVYKSAK